MPSRFIFPTEQDFRYEFKLTSYDGSPYAGKDDIQAYVSYEYGGGIVSARFPQFPALIERAPDVTGCQDRA